MARRPNLAAVDLKDTGKPAEPKEHARGRKAKTLRLPDDYWFRLHVLAALRRTTMVELVQQSLDEMFTKTTKQEKDALQLTVMCPGNSSFPATLTA